MDEAAFAKELNKYRVVRRPEHVGGKNKSSTTAATASTATSAKRKSTSSSPASTSSSSSGLKTFWDLLQEYAQSKGMSAADATKLVAAAKQVHAEKKQTT